MNNSAQQEISFVSDPKKLDMDFIRKFLLEESYWAKDRSKDQIIAAVKNSHSIMMLRGSEPVGFARMVTDYATFGYVMDVFVKTEIQNQGLGKLLMSELLSSPQVSDLPKVALRTQEAKMFYLKIGFMAETTEWLVKTS